MPHTQSRGLSEVGLLSHAADLRWCNFADATGVDASAQRDADSNRVYASIFFAEVAGFPDEGLAAYGPDDRLDVVSTLSRFGSTMLDGEHLLYPAGTLGKELPRVLPPAPHVRLSNVFVHDAIGPDDLRVTSPVTGDQAAIPSTDAEPDSYRLIRRARERGRFFDAPADATPLWDGAHSRVHAINADRDVNGVGLLYFVNYVAFTDAAERVALEEAGRYAAEALDDRRTVRRRIGFYGNANRHDMLRIDVEGHRLADPRVLLVHHRIRRESDDRLIAVSSVEKRLAR